MEGSIENNILIADFMGIENGSLGYINDPSSDLYKRGCDFVTHRTPAGELRFDSSWDWLMPVVDEIEHGKGFPWFTFKSEICIKENSTLSSKTILEVKGVLDRKKAYYKACVDFVKWYNENN